MRLSTGSSVVSGQQVQIQYIQQDRDSNSTVTFYLDNDRNPYNNSGGFPYAIGTANLQSSGSINAQSTTGFTSGVAAGSYWIAAKVTDSDGHVRFSYSQPITVSGTSSSGISLVASR